MNPVPRPQFLPPPATKTTHSRRLQVYVPSEGCVDGLRWGIGLPVRGPQPRISRAVWFGSLAPLLHHLNVSTCGMYSVARKKPPGAWSEANRVFCFFSLCVVGWEVLVAYVLSTVG